MASIDPELAARVWQRVRPGEEIPEKLVQKTTLSALIAREQDQAELFRQLAARTPGQQGAFARLFRQARGRMACLRGMELLQGGSYTPAPVKPWEERPMAAILGSCYGRSLEAMAEYDIRADDTEYGAVFACLAQQVREQCRVILEALGELCGSGRM